MSFLLEVKMMLSTEQHARMKLAAELALAQIKAAQDAIEQPRTEHPSPYAIEIAKLIAMNMSNSN